MIIHQSQNGSITERKFSPFKKKLHLLSEKIKNEKHSFYKNSFINEILNKPYYNKNGKNGNKSKTIDPQENTNKRRIIKTLKNNVNDKYINKNKKNYYSGDKKVINTNQLNNDNQYDLPRTSRCDVNIREKYLAKFFKNIINSNRNNKDKVYLNFNKNNNYIPDESMNSITHSKRNNSSSINSIWEERISKKNNKNDTSKGNLNNQSTFNFEEGLNYEFEIRLLKKKLKELKKRNNKLKKKIIIIKNEQKEKQMQGNKQKKKENIISKVFDICKNIHLYDKSAYNSFNETDNGLNFSQINKGFSPTKIFKNMLLNLMDLKYESQNILLKEEFISGLKNLLIKNENEYKIEDKEQYIFNKVKGFIKEEEKLKTKISKYKYLALENKKFYEYFSKLCRKLCIHSLENLDKFIKNTIVKSDEEFKQINQIKKIVMENMNKDSLNQNQINEDFSKKEENKKSKVVINNYNYKDKKQSSTIEQRYYRNKNNSESRIKRHLSYNIIKQEDKNNIKKFSYFRDKPYIFNNKSPINNNIYKNNDDSLYNRLFYTYKESCPFWRKKNDNLLKQNKSGTINVYDFSKQKNYDYYIHDYYNLENRDYVNEYKDKNKNNIKSNNNKFGVLNYIKTYKVYPYKGANTININKKKKNYNNIIDCKKKELGLNNNIKNKIKLNLKEEKNKNNKKSC